MSANDPEQYSEMKFTKSRNSSISEMEDKKTSDNINLQSEELSKEVANSPKYSSTSHSKENILDEQSVSVDKVKKTNSQEKSANFLAAEDLRNDIAQIQENLAVLQGQKEQLESYYEQEKKRFEEIQELRSTLNKEADNQLNQLDDKNKEADNQQKLLKQIQEEAEKAQLAANAKHHDMISALERRAEEAENQLIQKGKELENVQKNLLEIHTAQKELESELNKAKLAAQEAGNNNADLNNKVKSLDQQLDDKNKEVEKQKELLIKSENEAEKAQLAANAKHHDMISALERRAEEAENQLIQKGKELENVQKNLLEIHTAQKELESELNKAKLAAQEAGNNNADLNNKVKSLDQQLDDKNKEVEKQKELLIKSENEAEKAQLAANAKHHDMISALEKRAEEAENQLIQKGKKRLLKVDEAVKQPN